MPTLPQLRVSAFEPETHVVQVAEDARRAWVRLLQDGGQEGTRGATDVEDAAVLCPLMVLNQGLGTCVSSNPNLPHVSRHTAASLHVSNLMTRMSEQMGVKAAVAFTVMRGPDIVRLQVHHMLAQ